MSIIIFILPRSHEDTNKQTGFLWLIMYSVKYYFINHKKTWCLSVFVARIVLILHK